MDDSCVKEFTLLNNIQNDQIEQMLKVREEMLEKRECEQLTRLNQRLVRKEIEQKDFLKQLTALTETFQSQKQSIDKARDDITKGYDAAIKLIKQAFSDAKKIGYKMPLSRSSDSYKLNKHLGFGMLSGLNNIIIDELNSREELFGNRIGKKVEREERLMENGKRQRGDEERKEFEEKMVVTGQKISLFGDIKKDNDPAPIKTRQLRIQSQLSS